MPRPFFLPDGQPGHGGSVAFGTANSCGCDKCGPLAIAAAAMSVVDGGPVARVCGRASCDARLIASRTTAGVR